jgi:multiple sugar transport system ATP-binding protein
MLNLTPFLDRYPRELSGGQRQRVAMGRAMVRDADVFLFDEPLSNLDAKLRAQMRVEIRRLHDKLGATTIYVTHDQIEAMTMADTIVLMRGGRIEQVGTPDELYDRPASLFAADFIGTPSMNFISGQVGGEEGRSVFESPTFRLPLSPDMSVRPGQKVICGIRPADVSLDPDGPIEGELVIAEKTGADLHLHLSIADHDFIATTSREVSFTTGTRLRLAVPPDKVHLFDAATEIRI